MSAIPEATRKPSSNKITNRALDSCSLLTTKEVEAIEQDKVISGTPNRKSEKGLDISQCYFLLQATDKSVVLAVMRRENGRKGRNPREVWEETFRRKDEEVKDRDRETEEEEENAVPAPERITGLGDEAFWVPQRFGGVLYVLRADVYFTLSTGSGGDKETIMRTSKDLAKIVLRRL